MEMNSARRLSMNKRLSAAHIFDEDDTSKQNETKTNGKMKTLKKNVKKSPYKVTTNKKKIEYESDPAVLGRRQKQIDYGKNTIGYTNYIMQIPKEKRTLDHPCTPVKYMKYSRRGWDGLIKAWRQKLHRFDPNDEEDDNDDEDNNDNDDDIDDSDDDSSSITSDEIKEEPDLSEKHNENKSLSEFI